MKHKSMLVVCGDFPYPPNHGARVDIWRRIEILNKMGFKIDLIATVNKKPKNDDVEYVKQNVSNIYILDRKISLLQIISMFPLQLTSRMKLKYLPINKKYDIVLLEGEYVFPITYNKNISTKHYVLRVHNDEAKYFYALFRSEKIWWKKMYYLIESIKFGITKSIVVNKVKNLMFISNDEHLDYKNKHATINSVTLPPPVNLEKFVQRSLRSSTVLFVGSLFMINNQEGLLWFIKNVHPLLKKIPSYRLIIAGNSREASLEWLYNISDEKITIYDSPQDLEPIYEQSTVFINPMLNGAGVKLKTIDAIQNGLPVVSTTVGNQGTGLINGKHILVADNPELFAAYIEQLINDDNFRKEIVNSAQEFIREFYNHEKILSKFFSKLLDTDDEVFER